MIVLKKIRDYIKKENLNEVDYIISALPLSLIPVDIKNSIIQNSIKYLKSEGLYVPVSIYTI
jgi:phospholipid N-methyltransferase